MVALIHLNECVWCDGNAFCHLICCCWSSAGMGENDVYTPSGTKARLHGLSLPGSPHQSSCAGTQGASCACFEAVMLDSLNRAAGMMSTQWQNKQRLQTRLCLTCMIAEAEVPGLVLTYTARVNGPLIDQRSAGWWQGDWQDTQGVWGGGDVLCLSSTASHILQFSLLLCHFALMLFFFGCVDSLQDCVAKRCFYFFLWLRQRSSMGSKAG